MIVKAQLLKLYRGDEPTSFGSYKYDFKMSDGKTYGLFGKEAGLYGDIEEGDTLTFQAEPKGRFWNVKGDVHKEAAGTVQTPPQTAPVAPRSPNGSQTAGDDREKRIVRQSAIKAAVETVAMMGVQGLDDAAVRTEIFRFAFWFYKLAFYEAEWNKQKATLGEVNDANE